jgi:hypothetical protein
LVAGVLGEPQQDEADEPAALAGESPLQSKAVEGAAGIAIDDDMMVKLGRRWLLGTKHPDVLQSWRCWLGRRGGVLKPTKVTQTR